MEVTVKDVHIGKSSAGWCFLLCANVFKTLEEWIEQFNNPEYGISDEYGAEITPQEMINIITKRSFNRTEPLTNEYLKKNNAVLGPNQLMRCKETHIKHGPGTYDLMYYDNFS